MHHRESPIIRASGIRVKLTPHPVRDSAATVGFLVSSGVNWGARALPRHPNGTGLCRSGLRRELAAQEIPNGAGNFWMVRFQCEVTGVVEMHLSVRVVALERFSARGQKERIVLAPDRQQGRLLRAEIFLEPGIERNIAGIVQEEVKLDFVVAGPCQ